MYINIYMYIYIYIKIERERQRDIRQRFTSRLCGSVAALLVSAARRLTARAHTHTHIWRENYR